MGDFYSKVSDLGPFSGEYLKLEAQCTTFMAGWEASEKKPEGRESGSQGGKCVKERCSEESA